MLLINPKSTGGTEMAMNIDKTNEIQLVLPKILLVSLKVPLVLMKLTLVLMRISLVLMRISLVYLRISLVLMRITVLLFDFSGDFSGRNWNRNSNYLTLSNSWV